MVHQLISEGAMFDGRNETDSRAAWSTRQF